MAILKNSYRGQGMPGLWSDGPVWPSTDAAAVALLLEQCPAAAETPLREAPGVAARARVGAVWVKDETGRMGLGSFKALGAAYAIACDAVATGAALETALEGRTYVTASAGNHGLSVAAGARIFGARAVIVLSDTVPEGFAQRLRAAGAEVLRRGAEYEASMAAARELAKSEGWVLLSDSSWPGYIAPAWRLMEGYLQLAAEVVRQVPEVPSHVFLQAGVGGMAAAVAAYLREAWGDGPEIVVVEPEAAPCLMQSVQAGRAVLVEGPVSAMGRLDCKEPSLIALGGLARDADLFVTVSEEAAVEAVEVLAVEGIATTPSGAAGVAGMLGLGSLVPEARVLVIATEAAG